MMKRPLILVSNDDGVQAKGIQVITEALRKLGDVVVFAPDGARSGMSGALTSTLPLKYQLLQEEPGLQVYQCTGTPVDCVKLAMNEVLEQKPDLLVSGINHGGNQAVAVHYSGTLGAAMEGCVFDIPSLGLSLLDGDPDADFDESVRLAMITAENILQKGLPKGIYLNLNVPKGKNIKGIRISRQAPGRWSSEFFRSTDARKNPVFWLQGYFQDYEPENPTNDTSALNDGYASLVPCRVDVTDYAFMEELKDWGL